MEILADLGGVAEAGTLRRFGVTAAHINAACASGEVYRVRRGAYALTNADPVRVAELSWHGVSTCITAAEHRGLPVLDRDDRIHLRVDHARSQGGRNLSLPRHVVRHPSAGTARRLGVIEVIDDSARCIDRAAQLVLLDAALNRKLIVPGDITGLALGSARRRAWLSSHADGRAQSPLETLARVALIGARIPFDLQAQIPTVGRVDILVDGRVIVEIDGRGYHEDPAAFTNDRRRDRAAVASGFTVLRFTAADVRDGGAVAVEAVRAALRAPLRPPSWGRVRDGGRALR